MNCGCIVGVMIRICAALVRFDCYHHTVNGVRPNPVIKL